MPTRPPVHKPYPKREQPRAAPVMRATRRGGANARGYTYRWQQESKAFLVLHPLCECSDCTRLGRIRPSQVVDHRIPHRGDAHLFWARSNWQAMAKRCHDAKTAREDGGLGNRGRGRVGQKSNPENF